MNIVFKSEYLKERDILENLDVNKRVTLKVDWTDLARGIVMNLGVT
jgi:hypothetical protein